MAEGNREQDLKVLGFLCRSDVCVQLYRTLIEGVLRCASLRSSRWIMSVRVKDLSRGKDYVFLTKTGEEPMYFQRKPEKKRLETRRRRERERTREFDEETNREMTDVGVLNTS